MIVHTSMHVMAKHNECLIGHFPLAQFEFIVSVNQPQSHLANSWSYVWVSVYNATGTDAATVPELKRATIFNYTIHKM